MSVHLSRQKCLNTSYYNIFHHFRQPMPNGPILTKSDILQPTIASGPYGRALLRPPSPQHHSSNIHGTVGAGLAPPALPQHHSSNIHGTVGAGLAPPASPQHHSSNIHGTVGAGLAPPASPQYPPSFKRTILRNIHNKSREVPTPRPQFAIPSALAIPRPSYLSHSTQHQPGVPPHKPTSARKTARPPPAASERSCPLPTAAGRQNPSS